MFEAQYQFSNHQPFSSNILVSSEDLYTDAKGYGFVIEANKNNVDFLQISELNSGFDPWYWLNGKPLSQLNQSPYGVFISKVSASALENWPLPLHFKLKVPESGNYNINLTLTNIGKNAEVFIFTGRRRLMTYLPCLKNSASYTQNYSVNVTDIIPRGKTAVHTDNTLEIGRASCRERVYVLV